MPFLCSETAVQSPRLSSAPPAVACHVSSSLFSTRWLQNPRCPAASHIVWSHGNLWSRLGLMVIFGPSADELCRPFRQEVPTLWKWWKNAQRCYGSVGVNNDMLRTSTLPLNLWVCKTWIVDVLGCFFWLCNVWLICLCSNFCRFTCNVSSSEDWIRNLTFILWPNY